ncbi:hypothetical protein HN51_059918 [Arachis hypogaea]|uniref:Uncharacterized protein n=1 Tax=Arachis hypogaea TaxID=3818 RepID=A0A444X7T5_ARAHY|nr:uncharacterized protein LOC112784367 [Arachis hypogaea]QHN83438.1 uncharacterized protein DS421_20g704760 [Arachis hypogaea]RYQ85731.1 hypothetical protein Ahy_B10g105322 [Arachis hypogaea]
MMQQHEPSSSSSSSFSLHVSPSPSFSSYSSETLADIAARVINELRQNPHQNDAASVLEDDDDSLFPPWENENDNHPHQNDDKANQNDDDDFEFTFVSREQNTSPISADDIFYNGQIRPLYMYPLFGAPLRNDINNAVVSSVYSQQEAPVPVNYDDASTTIQRRLPLRMLMFEESCSSENDSVVDDDNSLERVPEGTYCVWNPNNAKVAARDRNNKKSNSTGTSSSKRWKIRELLLRSHSDGKGNKNRGSTSGNGNGNGDGGSGSDLDKKRDFVFGVTSKRTSKVAAAKAGSGDGYGGASGERDGKSGWKSVLPYRQELIGIFANVNGVGRNLHPF